MKLTQIIRNLISVAFRTRKYVDQYLEGELRLKMYNGESFADALSIAIETYLPEEDRKGGQLKAVVAGAIKSNLLFGFKPHEYFIYDLANKTVREWSEYLSEKERVVTLYRGFGLEIKNQLRDKWMFYQLAKPYFKREIFHLTKEIPYNEFVSFVRRISHVFCKPTDGHMGIDIYHYDIDENTDILDIYDFLMSKCKDWVIEECIKQGKEMAIWNESSVNTIRFPSFYRDGVLTPYYPRIRMGRKGQIVDNVAQGGLVAFVDAKTGVISTDGYYKKNETIGSHPDSGIRFKGTQIPHWQQLLEYANELHKSMPQHVYIAWDFAYSEKGWDVVEANWGQMDSTQMIIGHGIRKEFHELLGK